MTPAPGTHPVLLSTSTYDVLRHIPFEWVHWNVKVDELAQSLHRSRLSIARSLGHLSSLDLVETTLEPIADEPGRAWFKVRRARDCGPTPERS